MPDSLFSTTDLQTGSYCIHKSWGFGKIREIDTTSGKVVIDFAQKSNHLMDIEYAEESLEILPPDHVLVLKYNKSEELRTLANNDPVALVERLVRSLETQASCEKIQEILCPEIVAETDWKKWWENTRNLLKKSGRFEIPNKKNAPIKVLERALLPQDKALQDLMNAKGPAEFIKALEGLKKYESLLRDNEAQAQTILGLIESVLSKTPKSQFATCIQLIFYRNYWAQLLGKSERELSPQPLDVLPSNISCWVQVFEKLSSHQQAALLREIKMRRPNEWEANTITLLCYGDQKLTENIAELYREEGQAEAFLNILNRLIQERRLNSESMLWVCKSRFPGTERLRKPDLILAILSIIEREQAMETKRSNRLYDALISDKGMLTDLLQKAEIEDVRDITRAVLLSTIFKDLDKRSFLASIIKLHPEVESMVSGQEQKSQSAQAQAPLIVSWESLARRKAELEELINKKIPDNSKEIAIARSYGDLRENHEFKAAKEMQRVLLRRKAELEEALSRAQGTDFRGVIADSVKIGTVVTLKNASDQKEITYTILGAWDSDPHQGIISYQSALGQALLNKKVGEWVTLQVEEGDPITAEVISIKPYVTE